MSSLFDFDKPSSYAVMGNPISHSQSPLIHAEFAKQTCEKIDYTAIQVDIGGFEQAVGNFHANGGAGLNVTVPFKQDAFAYATQHSERASTAQAANTLVLKGQEVFADNTDGIGLVRDLTTNKNIVLTQKRLLILGAGGAVQGVLGPLFEEQPTSVTIVNRTVDKAFALKKRFSHFGEIKACSYEELAQHPSYDVVINATSAGIGGELPPIRANIVSSNSVCYDMFYAAQDTAFVAWSKQQGVAAAYDGLGMLVEQAAESFFLWRNKTPDTQPVIDFVRQTIRAA